MFLFNNTRGRDYREVYPQVKDVIFDLSDRQLQWKTNRDWRQLGTGSIACVVDRSRRMSTFCRISDIRREAGTDGVQEIAIGEVVASLVPAQLYSDILSAHGVSHPYLPNSKFKVGFNVANLGNVLDGLLVHAADGTKLSLGSLKDRYASAVISERRPPRGIPDGITRQNVLAAIAELNQSPVTEFGESTRYDLIHEGQRYAPKAVLGLAARYATAEERGPYDFKGGETSRAFRVLRQLGFSIERKSVLSGAREDWSEEEVRVLVADHFEMLRDELRERPYSKARHRRLLQSKLAQRSASSIEFKHRNVSAALIELNLPYIRGYRPASNYQALLLTVIQDHLDRNPSELAELERLATSPPVRRGFSTSELEQAQVTAPSPPPRSDSGVRSGFRRARRTDFRALDEANRDLGKAGEEFVLEYERHRLRSLGRGDLAERVCWTAAENGDGDGYDIQSFDPDGLEIFIEVKTTKHDALFPFLLSANELAVSLEKGASYRLYRVFDFTSRPRFYVHVGPIRAGYDLRPTMYEARLGGGEAQVSTTVAQSHIAEPAPIN